MRYTKEFAQQLEVLLVDAGFICTEHGEEKRNSRGELLRTEHTYRRGQAWVKTSYYPEEKDGGSTFGSFIPKFRLGPCIRGGNVDKIAARLISGADALDKRQAKLNALADPLTELLQIANIPFVRQEKKERIVFSLKIAEKPSAQVDEDSDDGDDDAPTLLTLRFRSSHLVLHTEILDHEWRLNTCDDCTEDDDDEADDSTTVVPQKVETYEDCLRVIRAQHDLFKQFLVNSLLPLRDRDLVTMDSPGEYLQYMLDYGVASVSTHEHTVKSTTGNEIVDSLMARGRSSEKEYKVHSTKIVFKQPFVGEPQ